MSEIRFTEDHEWIRLDGEIATVGITDFAQSQLGDIVFVELPAVGKEFAAGDEAAVVESVKAASEIYAPVGGTVTEANPDLEAQPATVNEHPMGEGWFFKMKINDEGEFEALMTEDAYKSFIEGLA